MLRRGCFLFAVNIPRTVWDPAQYNSNWPDSYSGDIAARRHWPAKKWSVGLEPRTPREWLRFSYRNLAYAYNGALRACSTFPEMLLYYKEMKQRGVKVDVDTLNILLTRAARYEHIQTDDIFLLFDELTSLGARPDISTVETLHTVLEHSASQPFEWREARRRQLVELYNHLATEEIDRLGAHKVDALLAAQVGRIRGNLKQLHSSLSPAVYRRYFMVIDSAELLLKEVHNFLWEFVSPDHPALDIASLRLRIPFVASVMRRPPVDADPKALKPVDFEDADVCAVIQAAVERCVDGPFHDRQHVSERRMYLSLLTMLTSSGVLYTSDLVSQLMDIVKYSRLDDRRDDDAIRLLRYALRGSSAANDEAYRKLWRAAEEVVDARVVGRYLASRDPWTTIRLCYDDRFAFGSYPTAPLIAGGGGTAKRAAVALTAADSDSGEAQAAADAAVDSEVAPDAATGDREGGMRSGGRRLPRVGQAAELRTADGLQLRWNDVKALVAKTRVLDASRVRGGEHKVMADAMQSKMEVFTGMMVFLRSVATGQRYGSMDAALATQAVGDSARAAAAAADAAAISSTSSTTLIAEGLGFDVWEAIFRYVQEVHAEMEKFIAQAPKLVAGVGAEENSTESTSAVAVEPEFECWEAMLVTLRCVLDFCVLHRQQKGGAAADAQRLFDEAAALRGKLVEESRTRFDGRMRILWLQEA